MKAVETLVAYYDRLVDKYYATITIMFSLSGDMAINDRAGQIENLTTFS